MIFKGILWCVHKLFKVKDTNLLSKEDLINSMSVAINDETNNVDEKEEQLFENDEKEIVDNIFVFDTLKVENVYTPNDKVLSLDISTLTIEKLNKVISNTTFSRIPIYDEVDDNIIGILVVKTYFEEYIKDPHLDIRSILLKPIYVDINDNIDDVFKELNKEKTHLGIVTKDNKMIGIISMEDILEELVEDIGINGKMNEIQAAIGLLNLNLYKEEKKKRAEIKDFYDKNISGIKGIYIPQMPDNTTNSYQYYPIVINDDYPLSRDELYDKFKTYNVMTRKYFYPLCSDYECYKDLKSSSKDNLPVANEMKNKVLCLPYYGSLDLNVLSLICGVLNEPI